jgi:hypothetical protein
LYRRQVGVGVIISFAIVIGSGSWLACNRTDSGPAEAKIRALGFAGSDLIYVLRRIAAEAEMPLALDEVRPLRKIDDLLLRWVDLDLPAGTVDQVLGRLRDEVGGFDYEVREGVLYVRSLLDVEAQTGLDVANLPGGTFEGDLRALGTWIRKARPGTFIMIHMERGQPTGPSVRMHIPEGSSVLDALIIYTRESGVGWRMRRAGQRVQASSTETAVVATDIQPWGSLTEAHNTAPIRQEGSMLQSLARIAKRTETPFCVFDPTPSFLRRGTLDLTTGLDPGVSLEESLDQLAAAHMPRSAPPFRWEMRDGVVWIRTEGLDRLPWLAEVLDDTVPGGVFEGTLPELGRFLTSQLEETSGRRIVGGEITGEGPAAKITFEAGTTVEDALLRFARESGSSCYLVIYDRFRPTAPHPEPWHGGFLSDLVEWGETARPY